MPSANQKTIGNMTKGQLRLFVEKHSSAGGGVSMPGIDDQTSSNDDQLTITDSAIVINEDSDDLDFRVESNSGTHAIFVDGGNDVVHINQNEAAVTTQIHNDNDVAITVSATEVVINDDSHATIDFRVESDGDTHALFVDASTNGVAIGGSTAMPGLTVVNDYQTAAFEGILDDGEYSGEVLKYSPGNDDTLTAGQLYFLHTDGSWDSTDANAVATGASQLLGVGLGGSSRTVGVLTRGFIRIPSTEILTLPGAGACDGLPLYVSATTEGHFDFTAPSGNADFVRIVGYAIDDATDVLVYFNPDHTWVKVSA